MLTDHRLDLAPTHPRHAPHEPRHVWDGVGRGERSPSSAADAAPGAAVLAGEGRGGGEPPPRTGAPDGAAAEGRPGDPAPLRLRQRASLSLKDVVGPVEMGAHQGQEPLGPQP